MLFKSKIELREVIRLLNIITLKHARKAPVYALLALITSNVKAALNYLRGLANN